MQGALIALEPRTGAVLALVGGRSYGDSQYNRATLARGGSPAARSSPSSTWPRSRPRSTIPSLPPITPATVVEDAPTVFLYEDKEYTPQNYEDEYLGYVTLRHGPGPQPQRRPR